MTVRKDGENIWIKDLSASESIRKGFPKAPAFLLCVPEQP